MKLREIKIYNFRSFGKEEVINFNKITAFIGNNSAGKTAALNALLKIFSENPSDRNLVRSDFHINKSENPKDIVERDLYIEVIFDFPELKEIGINKKTIPEYWEQLVIDEPGKMPYLRIRLEATWRKNTTLDGSVDSNIYFVLCSEQDPITEDKKRSAKRHILDKIRMIYIPAIRDPSKQLKNVSGTMLNRIMIAINWKDSTKEQIVNKIDELNTTLESEQGIKILKESVKEQWKKYGSDNRYTNAEMQFNSADLESILKKSEVVFTPTVTERDFKIDEMGDGLKSLFYISMVDSILKIEEIIAASNDDDEQPFFIEPPLFTIVALEELENHIAPHLIGKLVKKFIDISNRENVETIISSHSPAIIKRIDPEDIRYFRLNEQTWSTQVKKLIFPDKETMEDKYKYVKEAVRNYPEIYFSKLVVLGEGDSEEIVLPYFIELKGREIDSSSISIVPLGGRHVNHFWRLLNDLEIPFVTLLDLDLEREGGGWGRIHYIIQQLISIGKKREELLNCSNGILSEVQFSEMINWPMDKACINKWVIMLEKYNVFFSNPLDLDFMLLERFEKQYKTLLEEDEGPRINKIGKIIDIEKRTNLTEEEKKNFKERIDHDIRQTLKKEGGDGSTYTEEEKELMIWYNYFFLNRGKPTTHFHAMSKIDNVTLKLNMPEVLVRLIERINEILA